MPMTVVVTTALPDRFRGFLASCMCEVAPGVFTSPNMSDGVRQRVWGVLCDWFAHVQGGSIVMTWPSKQEPGGQGLLTLGLPKRELVAHDDMVLVRWPPPPQAEPPANAPA